MLDKTRLEKLYLTEGKSMQDIATMFRCSLHKVQYWMQKYAIKIRSTSDAIYLKNNPNGDPFKFSEPKTIAKAKLLGFGLGLYWGEGTKADKGSVRLGNTDPGLISKFIKFLTEIFGIKRKNLKFGLQLFTDLPEDEAMDFWRKKLKINSSQFYKVIITKSRGKGTYRKRSKYGVLTVYCHNRKLRDILVGMLPM